MAHRTAVRMAVAKALRGEGWPLAWEEVSAARRRSWINMADAALAARDKVMKEDKSRVIEDWKWTLLKSASMWLHYIGTLVVSLFLMLPTMPREVQALVPVEWQAVAIALWFALGIAARLWKQRA